MKCIFIDETSDSKFKDYHGLSLVSVDASHYPSIKQNFQKILSDKSWDPGVEFKGSFIFSAKKGDPNVDVPSRVEIAKELIALNVGSSNSRMKFFYSSTTETSSKKAYLTLISVLLKKSLQKPQKKNGKNLVSIHVDQRSDISAEEIRATIDPILKQKEWILHEDITIARSGYETVGILYADIVGYMAARRETIRNDADLFEGLDLFDLQTNGKIKKLNASTEILDSIKSLQIEEQKM